MQRKLFLTLLLVLVGAMTYLPRGRAQRSPYVPLPVNLPGLLPRFGEVDNSAATTGGSGGQQAPSSGGGAAASSSGEDVGLRLGEGDRDTRPAFSRPAVSRPAASRPTPSRDSSTRCPPNEVPCYDCVVYIAKDGRITRYMSPDQGGRRW